MPKLGEHDREQFRKKRIGVKIFLLILLLVFIGLGVVWVFIDPIQEAINAKIDEGILKKVAIGAIVLGAFFFWLHEDEKKKNRGGR
jgi:membrane associated rhomboid family serine protease